MAKKATSKDYQTYSNWQEAQNLSSYGSRGVPNKPVATGGKKTVPEVLDWGKGIPKDYLAYLNKQEMALVQNARKFKGKRNYKGIPAYPDPGDTAAGDTGQGTSSSAGLGNNTSPGNYHSTDTRYGNSTSNSTAGNRTGGGSDSGGSRVGSGIGGLGGSSATNSGIGSERASETAGTKTATGTTNADSSAMQSAAESDAATVSISSPALRRDAASGGINSIGIGPENNKINITNPSESSISGAIARSASAYKDVTPTGPGGGGMGQLNARRGSETVAVGPTSGTSAAGNIDRGSIYGADPRSAAREDSLQADMDRYTLSKAYNSAPSGVYGPRATGSVPSYMSTASMPGMITTGMPSDYSVGTPSTMAPAERSVLEQARINNLKEQYSLYGGAYNTISPPPTVPTQGTTPKNETVIKLSEPEESDPQARLTLENKIKRDILARSAFHRTASGTFTDPYEPRTASGTFTDPYEPKEVDLSQEAYFKETYPRFSREGGGIGSIPDTEDASSEEAVSDSTNPMQDNSGPLPPGVSPYQDEAVYPEKTPAETYITDHLPYAKYFAKGARYLGKKEFEHLTPEERNALAAKWVEEQEAYTKGDIPANRSEYNGVPGRNGGINSIFPTTPAEDQSGTGTEVPPKDDRERYDYGPYAGGRPYKYYQWDLGMSVPKPGDPDYNEYMYYLKQRRVNYA